MNKINKGNEHKLLAVYGSGGSKVPSSVHAWLHIVDQHFQVVNQNDTDMYGVCRYIIIVVQYV